MATSLGSVLAVALLLAVMSAKMLGNDWACLKVGCEVTYASMCTQAWCVCPGLLRVAVPRARYADP